MRFDEPTGSWMFVGVHSTVLGPGWAAPRMKVYRPPEDASRDVLRLSGAMTLKNAMADLPFGGGKAVLAVPSVPTGSRHARDADAALRRPGRRRSAAATSPPAT